MSMNYATSYAAIVKYDKNDDGTLMVYGKATDDTLDLDSQICDPKWLDTAMPQWFKSGGNIREMHGPVAAGIAKEYESKSDGHYIGVHVVDPLAAKKVEAGVYQGFSIGIKSPRVVRDLKAANGRIIDGQIIEVSLVDRPANPSAKLILAKSVEGESSLMQVEELMEFKAPLPSEIFKHGDHDQADHSPTGGGGSSSDSADSPRERDLPQDRDERDSADSPRDPSVDEEQRDSADSPRDSSINENRDNGQVENFGRDIQGTADALDDLEDELRNAGDESGANSVGEAQSALVEAMNNLEEAQVDNDNNHGVSVDEAYSRLSNAHDSLSDVDHGDAEDLQDQIADSMDELESYLDDYNDRREKTAITKTHKGLKMKKIERIATLAKSLTPDAAKFDQTLFDNARRALAELIAMEAAEMSEGHDERNSLSTLVGAVHALMAWYEGEESEGEVSMEHEASEAIELAADQDEPEADKALEEKMCDKCNKALDDCDCEDKGIEVPDSIQMEDTDQATSKTVEVKEISEAVEATETTSLEDVVEKAVKSAMEFVKAEIDTLRAENKSAVEKSVKLESDLATALSKSVAGGPKRTATKISDEASNDALVKAATYKAKADATTDPVLAKGYRALYAEFSAKAGITKSENE